MKLWPTSNLGRLIALVAVTVAGAAVFTGCRTPRSNASAPSVVDHVEVNRYLGKWYEIASFPQSFQRGCHATTAEYSLRPDGDLRVLNTCRKGSLDGELTTAEGKAWIVDESTNARLKVQFFWPFRGDYWIFELGDDYDYAVVGSPDRDSLWILSREPQMAETMFDDIVKRFSNDGWDMTRLQRTAH